MKKAEFFENLDGGKVKCGLCPHHCVIAKDKFGICGVRKNIGGELMSLAYGHPVSLSPDPIEKKPLFHFMPDSMTFSIGTFGCNFKCPFCQNWEISQTAFKETKVIEPKEIIAMAKKANCDSISYTYNEPTVFYEYMYDIADLAHDEGMKNIIVTNGFIEKEPLEKLHPLIDGVNVDLKSINDSFYKDISKGSLKPVLESLKTYKENCWLEITTLLIGGKNDSPEEINALAMWISENLGKDTPLHLTRFFPNYKMMDVPATAIKSLTDAREIAMKYLDYVYLGNMVSDKFENTYCPKCKKLLVGRAGFGALINKLDEGVCICGNNIPGVWFEERLE